MKKIAVLLLVFLLAGCSTRDVTDGLDAVGDKVEEGLDKIMNTTAAQIITQEQAVSIVLDHAGATQDQVTELRTEYETDHYDVEFVIKGQKYEYEVASDGRIISFEKDDKI